MFLILVQAFAIMVRIPWALPDESAGISTSFSELPPPNTHVLCIMKLDGMDGQVCDELLSIISINVDRSLCDPKLIRIPINLKDEEFDYPVRFIKIIR